MKAKYLLTVVLASFLLTLSLTLVTVNASQPIAEAKSKGNSHLKLLEITKTLQPDDGVLVWIDINATMDYFGNYYLPADPSLYGIKWVTITFAPDINQSKLFWCLAECQAQDVEKFLRIPWVFDIALVKVGGIDNEPSISPKLSPGLIKAIDRATQYNGNLEVIAWMQNSLDLSEKLDDVQGIAYETVHNVSATIEQFGGKLLRDYYEGCYSLSAALPAESIVKIAENPFVKKLYLNGPVVPLGLDNTAHLYSLSKTRDNINLYPFGIAVLWFPIVPLAVVTLEKKAKKKNVGVSRCCHSSFINFLHKYPFR